MNTIAQAAPQVQVTVNVTGWSEYQRNQLMKAIAALQADLDTAPDLDEVEVTGWTKDLVEKAFEHLASAKAAVQIKIIKRAIENGGTVPRDEVYEFAGYEQDRSLKGFTRPTNSVTASLRKSGELPEDADKLLMPIYDESNKSFQKTQGFRVPLEIVKLYSK